MASTFKNSGPLGSVLCSPTLMATSTRWLPTAKAYCPIPQYFTGIILSNLLTRIGQEWARGGVAQTHYLANPCLDKINSCICQTKSKAVGSPWLDQFMMTSFDAPFAVGALQWLVKVTTMSLSHSCNSRELVRHKKGDRSEGRGNLLNLRLRSHNFSARDDHHS